MAHVCEICGKEAVMGSSQKHRRGVAGKRWRKRTKATPRLFKPNLQVVSVKMAGERKQMAICAKCIKRIKKFGSIRGYTNVALG